MKNFYNIHYSTPFIRSHVTLIIIHTYKKGCVNKLTADNDCNETKE